MEQQHRGLTTVSSAPLPLAGALAGARRVPARLGSTLLIFPPLSLKLKSIVAPRARRDLSLFLSLCPLLLSLSLSLSSLPPADASPTTGTPPPLPILRPSHFFPSAYTSVSRSQPRRVSSRRCTLRIATRIPDLPAGIPLALSASLLPFAFLHGRHSERVSNCFKIVGLSGSRASAVHAVLTHRECPCL